MDLCGVDKSPITQRIRICRPAHLRIHIGSIDASFFDTSTLSHHCANADSAQRRTVGTMVGACNRARWKRSESSDTTKENQMRVKILLAAGAFSLALLIGGCYASPTPAAGPAGPPGDPGQSGQQGATGQPGDSGQPGDAGRKGEAGREGEKGREGDQGRAGDQGRTGDQGREGKDAPCPAGEHRHTNPDTGKTSCVRND
jgi:hypothetical protein